MMMMMMMILRDMVNTKFVNERYGHIGIFPPFLKISHVRVEFLFLKRDFSCLRNAVHRLPTIKLLLYPSPRIQVDLIHPLISTCSIPYWWAYSCRIMRRLPYMSHNLFIRLRCNLSYRWRLQRNFTELIAVNAWPTTAFYAYQCVQWVVQLIRYDNVHANCPRSGPPPPPTD